MSQAQPPSTSSTFSLKRIIIIVGVIVPAIVMALLMWVATPRPVESLPNIADHELALAQRIARVGTVALRETAQELRTGQEVYMAQCMACHAAGLVGSPILGDRAAWAPRINTGLDRLVASTLQGKGAMGAQGGGAFSDFEIKRAVVYLLNNSGANFPEPVPPVAAADTPAGAPGQ